jgi:hypothetical protein
MIIKRLGKKTLKEFKSRFEIDCRKVVIELVENYYFITINDDRPFSIEYDLIKDFI